MNKKLDVKAYITFIMITSLVVFVGYILIKVEITADIALLFFTVFTNVITAVITYFFTRKNSNSIHNEKTIEKG